MTPFTYARASDIADAIRQARAQRELISVEASPPDPLESSAAASSWVWASR